MTSCTLYRRKESAFSSHQEDQPKVPRRIRACPRQKGRKTTATSGHSQTPRTASDLGTYRLTRCVKRTSKRRVAGSNPAGRARSEAYGGSLYSRTPGVWPDAVAREWIHAKPR